MVRQMVRRSYRKNETLFHAGDPGSTLHVVEKGHVAIRVSTPSGDVATLTVLGPGNSFGEQALINESATRTASAVALDVVETRTLSRAEFERLRQSSPAVGRFLVEPSRPRFVGSARSSSTPCSCRPTTASCAGWPT